jgi:hypothetical protein
MFTNDDLKLLDDHGITADEAMRQLHLLRQGAAPTRLDRACTIGGGIVRLEDRDEPRLLDLAARAAADGRLTKFVPASGAATRMFKDLIAAAAAPRPSDTPAGRTFFEQLDRFPFAQELRQRASVTGAVDDTVAEHRVLTTLLHDMRYAELPKALIAFHRDEDSVRTAFEEHLLDGTQYTRGRDGRARSHFTVAPEFRAEFEQALARARQDIERLTASQLEVTLSEQHPSTDTIAITPDGEPFRTATGALLLRPAGHGALIRNLQALEGDLVVIRNIDNIQPFAASAELVHWKRLLIGYLVSRLGSAPLDRPVRVCGVVKNEGEPGGAPFWVIERDGRRTLQIVEPPQIDHDDAEQRHIFESSTHFNPVDLVCAVRRRNGEPFDLSAYVDPSAVFLAQKSHDGRDLIALERPGLWNGAMAHWHTVFVEVPAATFAPVKTVFDLLRPQHQSL